SIHDLAYVHFPHQIDKTNLFYYKKYRPLFAKKARSILTVSEYTRQDITEQYHIPEEKIRVVYNAANDAYVPLSREEKQNVKNKYTSGREYFLFVGALHPRKNIIHMLKAFVRFKRRQQSAMKLVIVGRMAWMTGDVEEARRRM